MLTPLMGTTLISSTLFASYGHFRYLLNNGQNRENSLTEVALAGGLGGALISGMVCPVEQIKTKLQLQHILLSRGQPVLFKGPLDYILNVTRSIGIQGLWKGFTPTFLREIFGLPAYFAGYEGSKRLAAQILTKSKQPKDLPSICFPFCGAFAGVILWTVAFPIDVVKTRLQSQVETHPGAYKNIIDCFRRIFREEGIRTFYKGCSASMLRTIPVAAGGWTTFELVSRFIENLD